VKIQNGAAVVDVEWMVDGNGMSVFIWMGME